MEREVSRIYNEAYDDISKKWNAYMKSHTAKVENALIALQKAIESGDQDRIKKAREYYVHTVKNVTVNNERFRSMRDETVAKISHTNEIALDYLNGNMASVYTVNYNAFSTEKVAGYSFALVNEQAIKELATTDKMLLPKKKVNIPKDEAWNKKLINSQMLQGILQGESIPKIAKRLRNVTNMNKVSAIRNARTMTTSAENKGRQDSFEKAQSDGVIMEREWIPAHDDRTRAWHLELGGVRVGVDEPWENEYGKIMYPGDPDADPANVYNCRCAIRAHVKGFKWNQQKVEEVKETEGKQADIISSTISDIVGDNNDIADQIYEYAGRMSSEDVAKFNKIFNRAKFSESNNGSHYVPETNEIELDKATMRGETMFHEGTHWYDYNQDYTITEDYGKFKWVVDKNGNLTGEREWVSDIVTIKEHAGFSQYIAHEWDRYEIGASTTAMADDRVNVVKKLGLSDTYGNNRKPEDVKHDLDAINKYLESKGISKTDPDFVHLSDFISAMTYDASLGSLTTGGHGYDYWVSGNEYIVTEITAGYNVLKCIGRTDFIEVEKELAPKLMAMIEKEWSKIW